MASVQKKYIGLLGGSFDPAHKGHLGISKIAIKKLRLKKVYWVITRKNPFKNKTFYSLDERIKYAKKISRTQKFLYFLNFGYWKLFQVSTVQKSLAKISGNILKTSAHFF